MASRLWMVLPVVVLAIAVLGIAAAQPAAADSTGTHDTDLALLEDPTDDPDLIRNLVELQPDGDATWTVEYRIDLDDNNTDAFQELAADINANSTPYEEDFREIIEPNVAAAANDTGRDMTVRNLSVSAEQDFANDQGVVAYQFVWTEFAHVEGDTVTAGDAIDGFLLGEDAQLTISWPETHEATEILPSGDTVSSQSVTWTGQETTFGAGEPRVTIQPITDDRGIGLAAYLLGALGAIAFVAVLVVFYRYHDDKSGIALPDELPVGTVSDDTASSTSQSPPKEELLTNEEQVLRLLEEKGGRMKQQDIVAELDWTEAKTSQVITGMREDGQIEVYRIGRENVITEPDEELL